MLAGYYFVIGASLVGIAFVLWYDYWYTPRHKKKHHVS